MSKALAIGIGGVGAGFLLVVALLVARRTDSETKPPAALPPRQNESTSRAVDAETSVLRDRVAKLEAKVLDLRARKEQLQLVKADLDREFKEKGVAWKYEEPEENRKKRWDRGMFNGVEDVASFLGVDPARRQALVAAWEDARQRAKLLEASRATVTVEGDVTTIKISPFPEEGYAVAMDLAQRVEAILTPAERDKYVSSDDMFSRFSSHFTAEEKAKYRTNRMCLMSLIGRGNRFPPVWDRARQITLRQSGDKVNIEELDFDAKGKQVGKSTYAAFQGQKDPLADFRHLLR